MTKEEIVGIVSYCKKNKVSYADRLSELGIPRWKFYKFKSKYFKRARSRSKADFIELPTLEAVAPPQHAGKDTPIEEPHATVCGTSIELSLPGGMEMRIGGEIDSAIIRIILQTVLSHVQP